MSNRTGIARGVASKAITLISFWGRAALLAGLTLNVPSHADAATINATSSSFANITSAIAAADSGDTVVVPPGTLSWPSTLVITKGITLQGAGNDATVILDNVPRTSTNQGGTVIAISSTPSQSFRLTGFTFRSGSLTAKSNAAIRFSGQCPSIRVDHCHFDRLHSSADIQIFGWLYGVIDHSTFDETSGGKSSVSVSHESWGGKVSGWGSWADPPFFGSEKFIFIEDNVINNLVGGANTGTIDGSRGGRFVVRHNTLNNLSIFYHGTDSGQGGVYYRGTRAVEIYNNTFQSSIQISSGQNRSGPLLFHDNTLTGTYDGGMALKTYRLFQGNPTDEFRIANGNDLWDLNVTESDGVTHIDGHSPYLFLTGSHTGGNNSATLVVANAGWTINHWAGYSVTNAVTGYCGYVASNTSDTITFDTSGSDARTMIKFNTRDGFSVHKVLVALDQPGRGQGDLLTGMPPTPVAWPHQALDPCYSWNNTLNGSNLDFASSDLQLRENVDYYNKTPKPGYTPYTYPHPLVSGPGAPSNLRVVR